MRLLGFCFFVTLLLFSDEKSSFYNVKLRAAVSDDQLASEIDSLKSELRKLGFVITMTIGKVVVVEVLDPSDINKLASASFHGGYAPTQKLVTAAQPVEGASVDTSKRSVATFRVFPNNGSKEEARARLEEKGVKVLEGGGLYSLLVEASAEEQKIISSWGWSLKDDTDLPQWMQARQGTASSRCRTVIMAY